MLWLPFISVLAPLISISFALPVREDAWPHGPLTTEGRWIKNSLGETVTMVGVNWPGAADTMIPEGLQYLSIADIVAKVKSLGMNTVRLTYATQMIDEYFENGEIDIPLSTSFTNVFGVENGTKLFEQVLEKNPNFNNETTRLEVGSRFFGASKWIGQLTVTGL